MQILFFMCVIFDLLIGSDCVILVFNICCGDLLKVLVIFVLLYSGMYYFSVMVNNLVVLLLDFCCIEDVFVDELYVLFVVQGVVLIYVVYVWIYVDFNCDVCELDVSMFEDGLLCIVGMLSVCVKVGFGCLLWVGVSGWSIYFRLILCVEGVLCFDMVYDIYYQVLQDEIDVFKLYWLDIFVIDCYFMFFCQLG